MKRLAAVPVAVFAAGLLLTGCSATGGGISDEAAGSGRAAGSGTTSSHPSFGQTYTYDDGLKVAVSRPQAFTPSDSAVGTKKWPAYVSFTVTLTNATGKNYDPTLFTTSLQSGSAEGEQVFDSAQGIDGSPTTPLLPGRQARFTLAYGVPDPTDLVLQVTPGLSYQPVIFTS